MTIKVIPTSAKIARAKLLIPRRARTIKMNFTEIAKAILNRMVWSDFLPSSIR
jgi:predicted solute-binding protein